MFIIVFFFGLNVSMKSLVEGIGLMVFVFDYCAFWVVVNEWVIGFKKNLIVIDIEILLIL